MKAKAITQMSDKSLKLTITTKKTVNMTGQGKGMSYQELKNKAAKAGMKVIGATVQEMKEFLEGKNKPIPPTESNKPKENEQNRPDGQGEGTPSNQEREVVTGGIIIGADGKVRISGKPVEKKEILEGDYFKHEKAAMLKATGMTVDEIAEQTKMSAANVRRAIWMHKTGKGIKKPLQ
jgi:hypothetical protein